MNLARFDLVSLQLFVVVARSGSITRGANQCHLAVAAASKRVSDLEKHLGVSLLYRHANGVKLTETGHVCFQHALDVLEGVERMSSALSDYGAGVRGQIRIWANTSAITQFMPADLAAFSRLHPGIRIELNEENSHEVVLAVLEGRAELGVFADRTPMLGLHVLPYRKDRLVLVVPKGHPLAGAKRIAFEAAVEHDFVSLTQGTSIAQRLALQAGQLGKRLRLRIQVRSFDAMCQMVAAGLGIAVLPDAAVQPLVKSLGLRKIELADAWAARELMLGARDFGALPKPARSLVDHLEAQRTAGS